MVRRISVDLDLNLRVICYPTARAGVCVQLENTRGQSVAVEWSMRGIPIDPIDIDGVADAFSEPGRAATFRTDV